MTCCPICSALGPPHRNWGECKQHWKAIRDATREAAKAGNEASAYGAAMAEWAHQQAQQNKPPFAGDIGGPNAAGGAPGDLAAGGG